MSVSKPLTISKSKLRCQTPVRTWLARHGCSLHLKIQFGQQNLEHRCIKDQSLDYGLGRILSFSEQNLSELKLIWRAEILWANPSWTELVGTDLGSNLSLFGLIVARLSMFLQLVIFNSFATLSIGLHLYITHRISDKELWNSCATVSLCGSHNITNHGNLNICAPLKSWRPTELTFVLEC